MLILILACLAILPACSDDNANDNIMGPGSDAAFVRVAHLSPDAPNVDVWVDGNVVLQDVPFRAFSGYLELAAGDHLVQVTPAGAATPVVIEATVTLAGATSYTIAARGLLGDSTINATVLVDDRATTSGSAEVRFVHASPDAPAVDITLTDATVLFGNVSFTEAKSIPVGAGTYDLQVRAAGSSTVVLSFADIALAADTNYTVYAIGLLGDGSLDAIVSVDAPGDGTTTADLAPATAEVRVGHLSPDAPNVDVYLDGTVVSTLVNVPFQAVSSYLGVEARTYNVEVYATGTSADAVIDADVTFLPGEAYTIAATGLLADLAPVVLTDDRTPPASGSHVRFVHASPDAPAVDVLVASGPTLFSATAFRGFAGYSAVANGNYDLEVRLTSDNSLALSVPGVQLDSSTNYTIFAIGLAGNATLAALPVVDTP
jgi:hypothetical protein